MLKPWVNECTTKLILVTYDIFLEKIEGQSEHAHRIDLDGKYFRCREDHEHLKCPKKGKKLTSSITPASSPHGKGLDLAEKEKGARSEEQDNRQKTHKVRKLHNKIWVEPTT